MNANEKLPAQAPLEPPAHGRDGAGGSFPAAGSAGRSPQSARAGPDLARNVVRGVAHCFNNLFQALLSRAELLRSEGLPEPRAAGLVDDLVADVLRGSGVVRQLLMITREHPRVREPVDLNDVVRAALARLARRGAPNGRVAVALAPTPCLVEGDREALEQAAVHLIENAQDFSPVTARVLLRTYRHGGSAFLQVTDRGPGVPSEIREKIFEPFFTTRRGNGHDGLGLAVALAVVAAHRGRREVASAPADGTTFRVILPAAGGG